MASTINLLTWLMTSSSSWFLKSRPVSFCCTRSSTSTALAFWLSASCAPLTTLPSGATELFVRALALDVGGADGSPFASNSDGATSAFKMEWRRARPAVGPARATSRSDWKFGPAGDAVFVKRHVKRGSWINCVRLEIVSKVS